MSIPQSAGGPITGKADLIEHLSSGSKPREQWRIGTEHEKFVYDLKSFKPVPYEGPNGIRALLEGMTRFGWDPVKEGPYIIGGYQNGASISLELKDRPGIVRRGVREDRSRDLRRGEHASGAGA